MTTPTPPTPCADATGLGVLTGQLLAALETTTSGQLSSWREAKEDLGVGLAIWKAASGSISRSATKLGLVYDGGAPTPAEARSICTETLSQCEQLATSRYVIGMSGAGEPLRDLVDTSTRQILTAVQGLADALKSGASPAYTAGVVWDVCDRASKVPQSNRLAYRRKFLTWASELKDSLDEFNQTLASSTDDPRPELTDDLDDDDIATLLLEDDDDDDAGYASQADKTAARRCLSLLETVGMAYRQGLLALDDRGKANDFSAIATLYDRVDVLARAATATAEELYPPLDKDDLLRCVDSLSAAFTVLAATADLATSDRDVPALWSTRVSATLTALHDLTDDDSDDDDSPPPR